MIPEAPVTTVSGRFWRSTFLGQEDQLLAPARAPAGRWHYDNQPALYLSGSPEGCRVALKVYLRPEDPKRGIFPIRISDARVMDLRLARTRHALGVSLEDIHVFWAELIKTGATPPTWKIADQARNMRLDGLLTPSRSRPDLTHLTLFQWNTYGATRVVRSGSPEPF